MLAELFEGMMSAGMRERVHADRELQVDGCDGGAQVGFIPDFTHQSAPSVMPLAPRPGQTGIKSKLRYVMLTFFIFLPVILQLSSLDWTHAAFWGGDGWSLFTLKSR